MERDFCSFLRKRHRYHIPQPYRHFKCMKNAYFLCFLSWFINHIFFSSSSPFSFFETKLAIQFQWGICILNGKWTLRVIFTEGNIASTYCIWFGGKFAQFWQFFLFFYALLYVCNLGLILWFFTHTNKWWIFSVKRHITSFWSLFFAAGCILF